MKTADRSVSRQKWREDLAKLKNPKTGADVWWSHNNFCFLWLLFLESSARLSQAAPCCSHPLERVFSGEYSFTEHLPWLASTCFSVPVCLSSIVSYYLCSSFSKGITVVNQGWYTMMLIVYFMRCSLQFIFIHFLEFTRIQIVTDRLIL